MKQTIKAHICLRAARIPRRITIALAVLVLLGGAQSVFAADGKALYETTCVACHGAKAQGSVPDLPDLAKNGSLANSDAELTTSILNGFKSKGSPLAMPPKGGNPNLTPDNAKAQVLYPSALTGKSK